VADLTEAELNAEKWAKLTPAQREAVEREHDERMAARLDELLPGEPSEHFTTHVPSRGPREKSTRSSGSRQT